jgi:hypothetical protein
MSAHARYLSGPRRAALAHLVRKCGSAKTTAREPLALARRSRDACRRSPDGGVLLHVHHARSSPACRIRQKPRAAPGAAAFRDTAELSGKLPTGNIVGAAEARPAVSRVGWTLARGGLNEVRTGEHGTPCSHRPGTRSP